MNEKQCGLCGSLFKTIPGLKRHITVKHKDMVEEAKGPIARLQSDHYRLQEAYDRQQDFLRGEKMVLLD